MRVNLPMPLSSKCFIVRTQITVDSANWPQKFRRSTLGGSRQQATIHTSVVYTSEETQSYATIFDSLRHDERAVWAHLEPVLRDVKNKNLQITTLQMMSDDLVTQYRSKKNMYCTIDR